jgi:hypothetical protein
MMMEHDDDDFDSNINNNNAMVIWRFPYVCPVPFLVAIILLYAFTAFLLLFPQEPIERFMQVRLRFFFVVVFFF